MRLYEFGEFRLDPERLLLCCDGAPAALGPKVVETLLALVECPQEILSKGMLLQRVWPEGFVDEASLVQNIYVLRKFFRARGHEDAIETVPRRGYRFTLSVRALGDTRAPKPKPRWLAVIAAGTAATILLVIAASGYGGSRESRIVMPSVESRLYAIGNFFLDRRTAYSVERSILFFSRAIALNSHAARDYGALADAHAVAADYHFGRVALQRKLARSDAIKALAIDPRCGRAYAALGLLAIDSGRYDDALKRLRRAVSLAPADPDTHTWYGIALIARGHIENARHQLYVSEKLDPYSVAATAWLSTVLYLDRQYAEAASYARAGLALAPQRPSLLITLGLAQQAQHHYAAALESFRRYGRSCVTCKSEAAALLAEAYVQLHDGSRARAELAIARADLGAVRPEDFALAAAAAGEWQLFPLPFRMTLVERALAANDPRFAQLSSSERLRVLNRG